MISDLIKFLIEYNKKYDLEKKYNVDLEKYVFSPLNYAIIRKKNAKLIEFLIGHSSKAAKIGAMRYTFYRDIEILKFLIASTVNEPWTDEFDDCPLIIAIKSDDKASAILLIDSKRYIHVTNNNDEGVLVYALENSSYQVVKKLLEAGVNFETINVHTHRTPLLSAASLSSRNKKNILILKLLLQYKPNLNAINNDGYNALGEALRTKNPATALALLKHGIQIETETYIMSSFLQAFTYSFARPDDYESDEDDEDEYVESRDNEEACEYYKKLIKVFYKLLARGCYFYKNALDSKCQTRTNRVFY